MARAATAQEQQQFLAIVSQGAVADWMQNHIVIPSITIAQACLESAYGLSTLTVQANNLFGIKKGTGWTGEVYAIQTKEQNAVGAVHYEIAEFRKYPSWAESIIDHTRFLTVNKRYSNIHGVTDFMTVANRLRADGYATDIAYPTKLQKVYLTHNLGKYDIAAGVFGGTPTITPTPAGEPAVVDGKKFIVQAGAYKDEANAMRKLQIVKGAGFYDAFIIPVGDDGIYRIQAGSYTVEDNAKKKALLLKTKGIDAAVITK